MKQANGLDLGKLLAAYYVYYKVIHDKISVTEASIELDQLMTAPPKYKLWQNLLIGGLASALIQPSGMSAAWFDFKMLTRTLRSFLWLLHRYAGQYTAGRPPGSGASSCLAK